MNPGGHDFSDVYTLYVEPLWFIKGRAAEGAGGFLRVVADTDRGRTLECVVLFTTFENATAFVAHRGLSPSHDAVTTKTLDDFATCLDGLLSTGTTHACTDPGFADARVVSLRSLLDGIRSRHGRSGIAGAN